MATQTQPPADSLHEEGEGRRQGRRRRQFGALAAGAVTGWLIGFGLEYAVGARLVTGSASNPFSVAFGLPLALAVACGLFGLMLGTAGDVEVVDAPVRMARFHRLGRAATSERGQLPGSPVAPRTPHDPPRD
ncbi:MAG: hypothetical protein ABJB93_03835 [Gaiellales bacterium]